MEESVTYVRLMDQDNHVCFIVPDAIHFENNLRKFEARAKKI